MATKTKVFCLFNISQHNKYDRRTMTQKYRDEIQTCCRVYGKAASNLPLTSFVPGRMECGALVEQ